MALSSQNLGNYEFLTTIKRFEYSSSDSELKKQTDFAKNNMKAYTGLIKSIKQKLLLKKTKSVLSQINYTVIHLRD